MKEDTDEKKTKVKKIGIWPLKGESCPSIPISEVISGGAPQE